jgi:homopolymeric O-antigen transport system permease protein
MRASLAPRLEKYSDTEILLRPETDWLRLDLNEIWRYRDLFIILIWRDFAAKYKQTILGPLWFIIQPTLTTLVFTVIFGYVARLPTDGLPPLLFYLCGQLGWSYFATNFNSNSAIFVNNARLFEKVYFPRLLVPLSAVVSNLFAFLIQALTFLIFFVYFKWFLKAGSFGMDWRVVFLPFVIIQTAALSLGVSLLASVITAKFRDLMQLSNLAIQLWMFATPVIVPLSKFPPKWQWIVALNPMTTIVESFRLTLLGTGLVVPQYVFCSIAMTLLSLAAGLILFEKAEKTFIDTV